MNPEIAPPATANEASGRRSVWAVTLLIQAAGTLLSRVLGLLRDVATAALLGSTGVFDAFTLAFRVPDVFRRLLGDGTLAAALLPLFTQRLEADPANAWQFAGTLLRRLSLLLAASLLVAELACLLVWWLLPAGSVVRLAAALELLLLPYVLLVCIASQLAALLQVIGRFSVPALTPALVNICWLVAAAVVAPSLTESRALQAAIVCGGILLGGGIQMLLHGWALRHQPLWSPAADNPAAADLRRLVSSTLWLAAGLSVLQINSFVDSLVAWGLTMDPSPQAITTMFAILEPGAVASLYLAERLVQFPLGLIGVALATVLFPTLSRHAARGEFGLLTGDLTRGLELGLIVGWPAGVGLALVAEPLAVLLFAHGDYSPVAALQTGRVLQFASPGVPVICTLTLLWRAYSALGDHHTPARLGLWAVVVNLIADLVLVWPLGTGGLALSSVVTAALQLLLLAWAWPAPQALPWPQLARTAARCLLASLPMMAAVGAVYWWWPTPEPEADTQQLFRLLLAIGVGVVSYAATGWLLGLRPWRLLR